MIVTGDKVVTDIVEKMRKKELAERSRQKAIRDNWLELKQKGFGYAQYDRIPVDLDYPEERMFCNVIPDKAWKGQRCFIIGGGESLKKFDFSKLKNELVIGVNRAYEKIDCTINYAMDHTLYEWITEGKLGQKAKEKFEDFKGFPAWLDSAGYDYPKGIYILNESKSNIINYTLKYGIAGGSNSGFGALNLAICLGANPIYLLGFDMKAKAGKQIWWHNGYPEKQGGEAYKAFINDFKRAAKDLKKNGFKIINLNPKSELKCFEFGRFRDIKPINRPIITSYYTKGTGYEKQVENLKDTLRRFNLENDVVGIPDQGDWHRNVYYKPKFILRMMNKHRGRPIVFVDADAKIRRNPVLFNDFGCDFACHFHRGRELLSGTLYFGNTKGAHYLVRKWIEEDKLYPTTHMPQKNLRAVFNREKDNIIWKALPVEYCMIFDSYGHPNKAKTVVEHFQLSRIYKNSESKNYKHMMSRSIAEVQEFCKGKRICLIGNADSVLKRKRKIDSFDVIGRMNRGMPRGKEEFIGSRTDILFLSTGMSGENILRSYNPRFVIWMTVCRRLADPWVLKNAIQNPRKDWKRLYGQLSINPTTGLLALYFMLKRIDFKSLTIYGFDFFTTKTWYNTKVDSGQKHSGKKEKKLILKMIAERPNVKLIGWK